MLLHHLVICYQEALTPTQATAAQKKSPLQVRKLDGRDGHCTI